MTRQWKSKPIIITIVLALLLTMAVVLVIHENPFADPKEELVKKNVACGIIALGGVFFVVKYDKLITLPVELFQNRRLIWKLARNDFKTRYAGSWMGMVWAFVQPVVTIALYYFVFEVVFTSRAQLVAGGIQTPYVLWLTAGLVPWFFFSEAINNGTNALLEYNYLVKKVVFKISILPIIKVIAASFIHCFFVVFMLIMYFLYGYPLDAYLLQIIYYSLCMFLLVLALSYSTCAIVVFFRDLGQIINIFLQVGMWATPILWNINTFQQPVVQFILKLNPVFYIVNGYRSALFEKTWFWEDFYSTMYFWIFTAVLFGVGTLIFKKLKVHFADVL